ncbi:hypothetical protein PROQFM164_S05g000335 [Penicillium roqueforti FM164]|uniref:Uncharacterized protein n=1 Tax=Penicillium roqueforti (strain FM164) TaxID=1365484 RepID=W6R3X7_PENRF|nr:hypothetical protein PROQFM164_S05g000335 [Penicillium roqueforti FM164]
MVKYPVTSREDCYGPFQVNPMPISTSRGILRASTKPHLLSGSDELRHPDIIGCREKRKAVDRKPQTTAGPTSETVVYRDYGSHRPFLINGDMDEATFLRDFCGRREYG